MVLSDEFKQESVRNEEEELETHGGSKCFSDENTGEELPEHLVRAAREEECSFMVGKRFPSPFAGSVLVDVLWLQGGWM